MSLWNIPHHNQNRLSNSGFNPCFRDVALEQYLVLRLKSRLLCFNLVFVDVALNIFFTPPYRNPTGVSILVFVDVALQRYNTFFAGGRYYCFNPCFRGCRSGTRLRAFLTIGIPRVSILVFVDVALERHRHRHRGFFRDVFQSLFSWMSLWNSPRTPPPAGS